MDNATTSVINYLEQRAEVDRVHLKDRSSCSSDAFIRWEEKNSCELPEDLKKFYAMSDGLEIRWSVKLGTKNVLPTFLGRMFINSINDLTKVTSTGAKQMAVDELNEFAAADTPKFNSTSWQIFELDPCEGYGRVCLVFNPYNDSSIWFLDRSLCFHRLSSTFTEYYRLLLLHCGLPFWHYKYTDVGIPPYILHWYYTIVPSLFMNRTNDEQISSNLISFSAEKVFQRVSKNSKATNPSTAPAAQPNSQSIVGVRSATQNQKRSLQMSKGLNRSSSVPRSMNN